MKTFKVERDGRSATATGRLPPFDLQTSPVRTIAKAIVEGMSHQRLRSSGCSGRRSGARASP